MTYAFCGSCVLIINLTTVSTVTARTATYFLCVKYTIFVLPIQPLPILCDTFLSDVSTEVFNSTNTKTEQNDRGIPRNVE